MATHSRLRWAARSRCAVFGWAAFLRSPAPRGAAHAEARAVPRAGTGVQAAGSSGRAVIEARRRSTGSARFEVLLRPSMRYRRSLAEAARGSSSKRILRGASTAGARRASPDRTRALKRSGGACVQGRTRGQPRGVLGRERAGLDKRSTRVAEIRRRCGTSHPTDSSAPLA